MVWISQYSFIILEIASGIVQSQSQYYYIMLIDRRLQVLCTCYQHFRPAHLSATKEHI